MLFILQKTSPNSKDSSACNSKTAGSSKVTMATWDISGRDRMALSHSSHALTASASLLFLLWSASLDNRAAAKHSWFWALGESQPLSWIKTAAQKQGSSGVSGAPALQCLGGISADIYSCIPRGSNSPIWKHQSSEGARSGFGNSKQQEMGVWGFVKAIVRIWHRQSSSPIASETGRGHSVAPESARKRGVPAVHLGGRISVHLPCTCVHVRACMQNTPGRAADLIFLSPSKAPTLEMAWGTSFHQACSALGNELRNP